MYIPIIARRGITAIGRSEDHHGKGTVAPVITNKGDPVVSVLKNRYALFSVSVWIGQTTNLLPLY
jgi:hypothetical protein